jgi:hypothetical protein
MFAPLRACLKFHQSAASGKFHSVLRQIFSMLPILDRDVASSRCYAENIWTRPELNLLTLARSWKFRYALILHILTLCNKRRHEIEVAI